MCLLSVTKNEEIFYVIFQVEKQLKKCIIFFQDDTCYVANVGDSRAVISMNGGKVIEALTRDHKPMDRIENARIHQNGGRVY